jgi:SAM-dependent methyltransferase
VDPETPPEVVAFYERGSERERLSRGRPLLERARVRELVAARLPDPPATVVDVGGGTGVHARWLAERGYAVQLVDPVPLHVEQAAAGGGLASTAVADARALPFADGSAEAVLLLGPLYHLTARADRVAALCEARRVVAPGGAVLAVGVCRTTWLLDGLVLGRLFDDATYRDVALRAAAEGTIANPTGDPRYFTSAYAHEPDELAGEAVDAGLDVAGVVGVEGPGWLLRDFGARWRDEAGRTLLLDLARGLEGQPALSAHLFLASRRPG